MFYFLKNLWLSSNSIFDIHDMAFNGLNTLNWLDISLNQLTNVLSLVHLRSTLRILDLSWNRILSIGDSYFLLCINIANINLDMNQLKNFPCMQSISSTITTLSLEDNNISLVDPMHGCYFPKLKDLQLVHNQIEIYCFPPRHVAPQLSDVYLQNTNFQKYIFRMLNHIPCKLKYFWRVILGIATTL